jgi:hypothetical protein
MLLAWRCILYEVLCVLGESAAFWQDLGNAISRQALYTA